MVMPSSCSTRVRVSIARGDFAAGAWPEVAGGADVAVAGANEGKADGAAGVERSMEQRGVARRTEASKSNDAGA